MLIIVNNEKTFEVKEDFLTVKDKKLYNKVTKEYEGVDGDIVSFERLSDKNTVIITRGTVDGYTCNKYIKMKGVESPFTNCERIRYEHVSVVDIKDGLTQNEIEEQELLMAEM